MKTDIEIAQEAVMEPIKNVAARCGISEDDLELYGKYKAKISDEYINSVKDNEDGKLILVTAINPTPAGEGKTTITVGLGEAFGKLGKKAVIALREPSLEQQVVDMHRLFLWKSLICILQAISMQSHQLITYVRHFLITIYSRATNLELTQDVLHGKDVWI